MAWIFASRHQAQSLALSYEELAEMGYLTEVELGQDSKHKLYQWEDGILFSITPCLLFFRLYGSLAGNGSMGEL